MFLNCYFSDKLLTALMVCIRSMEAVGAKLRPLDNSWICPNVRIEVDTLTTLVVEKPYS